MLLAIPPGYVSPFWPPAGIALAAVLWAGGRVWPGILLGHLAFSASLFTDTWLGLQWTGILAHLGYASGSTLQALVGARLVRGSVGEEPILSEPRQIARFLLLGGAVASAIAASVGTMTLILTRRTTFTDAEAYWVNWWAGDTLGVWTVAPVALLLLNLRTSRQRTRALTVVVPLAFSVVLTVAIIGAMLAPGRLPQLPSMGLHAGATIVGGILFLGPLVAFLLVASGREARADQLVASLAESETRYRTLVEHAADGIVLLSADDRIIEANQAWLEMLRGTRDTVVGRHATTFFPQDALAANPLQMPTVRLSGEYTAARVMLRNDGTSFPAELRSRALSDGRILTVVRDVTERVEAEATAAREAERLRLAVEAGAVGLWEWNTVTDELSWNDVTHQLFGVAPEDTNLSLSRFLGAVHPDDRPELERRFQAALEERRTFRHEYRIRPEDGGERWLQAVGRGLYGPRGEPRRMLGAVIDTTARRELHDRLKASEAALLAANDALEQRVQERTEELSVVVRNLEEAVRDREAFAYSVSHDLRAPLRAIGGFADILIADHSARLDEEARNLLGIIRRSAVRMDELINDLLALSKTGTQDLRLAPVEMGGLVWKAFQDVAGQESAEISFRVGDLPRVTADGTLLWQIWTNLLGNAVKFTAGRATRVIEVGAREEEGQVIFFVQDNGVGFDPRYAGRMFEAFYRLHPREDFAGTGMGLALVRRSVERMGGTVWAEGRPGQGATVYFALPRDPASALEIAPAG